MNTPAAECTRKVSVRKLPLKRTAPSLALRRIPAIRYRPVQRVDIGPGTGLRRIAYADDELSWELIFRDGDLAGRDEIECRLVAGRTRKCPARDVGR